MKYLIVGLGNIGDEYAHTRHNIGFDVVEALVARNEKAVFKQERLAFKATLKYAGKQYVLIKPTTYVNLSGKAVAYWMQKEKIPANKILVVVDDIAFPFGTIRLKPKGGSAGHNGLEDIERTLGTSNYAKLRFGIGKNFEMGHQVDYVLGQFLPEEQEQLPKLIQQCGDIILSFGKIGLSRTMNLFNTKDNS